MNKILLRFFLAAIFSLGLFIFISDVSAVTQIIDIEIKNHLFVPSEITISQNTKVKLIVHNKDSTSEEFESYDLNRQKVIAGKHKGVIFIGPLPAGEYLFFGEFYPKTARGKLIVK